MTELNSTEFLYNFKVVFHSPNDQEIQLLLLFVLFFQKSLKYSLEHSK